MVININAIAPFEITDKKEVTAMGEPSYTSAVHKWNGTIDNLNANADSKKTNAKSCRVDPSSCPGIKAKLKVPVMP